MGTRTDMNINCVGEAQMGGLIFADRHTLNSR